MDGQADELAAPHIGDGVDRPISHDMLRGWVEQVTGGRVSHWHQIAGGNRYWSFGADIVDAQRGEQTLYLRYQPPRPPSAEPYTLWREARFYEALRGIPIPAPKLVAVHETHQAILTQRMPGKAEFRRIKTAAERMAIATEFVEALAVLHAQPISTLALPGHVPGSGIVDCVRQELAIWRAMYEETNQPDPLIDLALGWLEANVPSPTEPPVFVHGDAGQGNFLFEDGHLTALLDWELAHVGDPMEDLGVVLDALGYGARREFCRPDPPLCQRKRPPARFRPHPLSSRVRLSAGRHHPPSQRHRATGQFHRLQGAEPPAADSCVGGSESNCTPAGAVGRCTGYAADSVIR